MNRYFIWKDANCNGIDPEWMEISGEEFAKLKKDNPQRRFIPCYNDDDPEDVECFLYETTKESFRDWNREHMKYVRHNVILYKKYKVVSLDDLVDENDEEGLTWAEIIPDTSEEDAAAEKQFRNWKNEMLIKIRDIIKDMDDDTFDMFWNLVMNPKKEERMTRTAYAEVQGVTQQAISKRLDKYLEKFRAQLGCKTRKRV